ncbi:Tm-1-like ATP-binding domain-containing protein [Salinactinospora qingdaonensis]|uniref:Tm-1-like ATP-binding domain-containing protein n=1 Tax=Salinactinospora qingdaonensis TaxID=702744 RepID=A0ABP7FG21_9ACTN
MPTVLLVGTFDTKGVEYTWLRDRIGELGCGVRAIDAGVGEPVGITPDVAHDEVAAAAGADVAGLRAAGDRGEAVRLMGEGAARIVERLIDEGRGDAVLAVGGSGGSSIAARAVRDLPLGVPKLLVSTMASGDVAPYVGAKDVTVMYSVVDIAGVNRVSERILGNAAAAIVGMAREYARPAPSERPTAPLVAASMFGVTTPAVEAARARLEELGYEVLVFHATGAGGRALESLAESGLLHGVLDLTTTELADELVGGVLSAGPDRLRAAGRRRLPQVVAPGALDMVNFGPKDTVPERFAERTLYEHNPTVTLMRTSATEMTELGEIVGQRLHDAAGPTALFWPLRGVSALDAEGMPFHDPAADQRCREAAHTALAGGDVEFIELDRHINDPAFAVAMADRLHMLIEKRGEGQ